jgi:type 1 glutamine amidotransferase
MGFTQSLRFILLAFLLTTAMLRPAPAGAAPQRMLVVSQTAGFRRLWETEFAESAAEVSQAFNAVNLKRFDVVVFLNTTGELAIDDAGKAAFLAWLRGGKAFVGMHSATDTFYKWPEFGRLIGGYFDGHPWHQKITVKVEDGRHAATQHLGSSFEITDEMYQFREWSREGKQVLLSVDNASINTSRGKRADNDYAVAWTRSEGEGRVFYTSLGHRAEVWRDPRYQQHIAGGIAWAMRQPTPSLATK